MNPTNRQVLDLPAYNLHPNLQTPYEPHIPRNANTNPNNQGRYASPMQNNMILSSSEENTVTMQKMYPNRYNIPVDVQDRGVSHQVNSNLVYHNNKEGWNTRQFDRNNEYAGFFNQSYQNRLDSMNISFTDNYAKQRQEAYDMFNKRNHSMEQPQASYSTQSNVRFGFVDFQDPQYRDYLKSKETKRKDTNPDPVNTDYKNVYYSQFSQLSGRGR